MNQINSVDRLCEMKRVLVHALQRERCPEKIQLYRQAYDQVIGLLEPDIREFFNERAAIIEHEGQDAEVSPAKRDEDAIIERKRLEVVRQLAALPGITTGRQMQAAGRR